MYQISQKIVTFIPWEDIEEEARQQIKNISEMSFVFKHIAVMPDCHVGKGATVGSVIATQKAIIPTAVGVDLGCGKMAVKTQFKGKDLPKDLKKIRLGIERRVPCLGRMPVYNRNIQDTAAIRIEELKKLAEKLEIDPSKFDKKWEHQLGSLGGGNHFIEISVDENDDLWAFLHSGSRGIGNKIACYFIKVAQEICEKFMIPLKDRDLAYLVDDIPEFKAYISHVKWAQYFALLNRQEMMDRVLTELKYTFGKEIERVQEINCHHNFVEHENHFGKNVWLTRKGAISAQEGQFGLIPGSMGTASYVVKGLGNEMSFCSSPHGAGRRFSRTEARRRYNMEDYKAQTIGVEARQDKCLIDELPAAYKDINVVMENAKELVKIVHTFKQLINVKGD